MNAEAKKNAKAELAELVPLLQTAIQAKPGDYIEFGCDEPFIEIRLQYRNGGYAIHTGDPSYDQDHRGAWGAGLIGLDTDAAELADDLIEQVEEAEAWAEA
jgi:hypothetical protein